MRIAVRGLRKTFRPGRGQQVKAVDDVSFGVDDGEFLVILGPSGSGKTTLLRCIAGLERADAGEIEVDGRLVFSSERKVWTPPERRGISMVFQSYALWPHMTVFSNVAYPLRTRHVAAAEVRDRVARALALVGCGPLAERYPSQLSGGQQQRVAVARAIVNDSRVVLFDEPLSSVDARVRDELRRELKALQRELGFASVYITHDQLEASVLGDRVAVLADGAIAQLAPPRELYDRPTSRSVAEFMGVANQFDGVVEWVDAAGIRVRSALGTVMSAVAGAAPAEGAAVTVIFRPEHARLTLQRPEGPNRWACIVEQQHFLGTFTEYVALANGTKVIVRSMDARPVPPGMQAWLGVDPRSVRLVPRA